MVKGMGCDSNNQHDSGCEACILGRIKKETISNAKGTRTKS